MIKMKKFEKLKVKREEEWLLKLKTKKVFENILKIILLIIIIAYTICKAN